MLLFVVPVGLTGYYSASSDSQDPVIFLKFLWLITTCCHVFKNHEICCLELATLVSRIRPQGI